MAGEPGHDLVVIGGGLAGAAVALAAARAGARVLVLERERRFRDRIRGEVLYPWGVAEAERLGALPALLAAGAGEVDRWVSEIAPLPMSERSLAATAPAASGALTFHHPAAQESLLGAAASAGAEVWRGVRATGIVPGSRPSVAYRGARAAGSVSARVVAVADGRGSVARRWLGLSVQSDPSRLVLAGALFAGLAETVVGVEVRMRPSQGLAAITIPLGDGRSRVYGGYDARAGRRGLSGPGARSAFEALCLAAGVPQGRFATAELAGPLAEFDAADDWVSPRAAPGVVLVGDAAATSDPSWGCGVSLALRDARTLTDALLTGGLAEAALARYASEHEVYHTALRRQTGWLTEAFRSVGEEADRLRRRVLPRFARDPSVAPDVVGVGPDGPSDDDARRRFLGE